MPFDPQRPIEQAIIRDASTGDPAAVNATGQIAVTASAAQPPAYDLVQRTHGGDLGGSTQEDDEYTIPDGKKLLLVSFSGTAHASSSGDKATKIELYYDPDGDGGANMVLLRAAVLSNSVYEFDLGSQEFVGDGAAKIRMRRESLDSQTRYAPSTWTGFVEQ